MAHEAYQVVFLRWVDSCNLFGDRWAALDDLEQHQEETFCLTLGFLVGENDHSLFVAGSLAPEEIGSVMQIPRVSVVSRVDLGVADDLHGGGSGCGAGVSFGASSFGEFQGLGG